MNHECETPNKIEVDDLPDIQETEPYIKIPIQQCGVENVEVPFKLEFRSGGFCQLNAKVSMRTSLDKNTKGISMSRLLLTLKPYLDLPLKNKLIKQILEDLRENIGAECSFMKFNFSMPIIKNSIKSDNRFPIYYKCRFEGQLYNKTFRFFQGVTIQYASYCPCSAELCTNLFESNIQGYPHNQRSFADILIEGEGAPHYIWLEDIIEEVESKIMTLPYPVIKRVDEQEIARVAAENALFVEDAIRLISQSLDNIQGVADWIVKCRHEESIHTSEAIAINWKGREGGFNGGIYI